MDINSSILTIITALIGILCGTAVGAYFNLKSARKDIIFKRKLEYFEKLSQDLEKNMRLYKKAIMSLSASSKKKEINTAIQELKQNRKTFLLMASPLYYDIKPMTEKVTLFVSLEKEIFALFDNLLKNHKSKSANARTLFELNEALNKISKAEEAIIIEMKR
jgi:hypothetical protein